MTANNPVIIFHRSNYNSKEDFTNQRNFLRANREILKSAHIIDYMTGDHSQARKLFEVYRNIESLDKVIVIMNSFLSKQEYALQYDLYFYLRGLREMGLASIYLMDQEGRLYKEVKMAELYN